jgi:Restriction alleviation protein Lar
MTNSKAAVKPVAPTVSAEYQLSSVADADEQRGATVGAQFTEREWGRPIYGAPPAMQCPFCGAVAEIFQTHKAESRKEAWDGGNVYLAQCSGCLSQGPGADSQIEAAEAWNRRPKGATTAEQAAPKMAPMSNDNTTPIRPPSVPTRFDELQRQMMDQLNALSCAAAMLDLSGVTDQNEIGSRASSTIHVCDENLHRLMNEIEEWDLQARRERTEEVSNV